MKRLLENGPRPTPPHPQKPTSAAMPIVHPRLPKPTPPPLPAPLRLAFNFEGTRTVIDRDSFLLGRSGRETNLILRDAGVSRQHAMVERRGGAFVITDMASMNGVIVNGTRVARAVLKPGDVVVIGPFELLVERA